MRRQSCSCVLRDGSWLALNPAGFSPPVFTSRRNFCSVENAVKPLVVQDNSLRDVLVSSFMSDDFSH